MKSPEPPKPEKSLLTLAPGDMVEVSLVMYELIGKTVCILVKKLF